MIKRIWIHIYRNGSAAKFVTKAIDGTKVKHFIYKDEETNAYWHERYYLDCNPEMKPTHTFTLDVSDRVFFGKARLVRYRDACLPETWNLVAGAVNKLEEFEQKKHIG